MDIPLIHNINDAKPGSKTTYDKIKMNGLSSLLDQWDRYDMLKGSNVRLIESGKPIEGKVTGISQQGALQVLTQNGVKELYSSKYIEFI